MMSFTALGLALIGLAQASGAGAPQTPSPPNNTAMQTPVVTVIARKPVIVNGFNWCLEPKPARYPADHDPQVVDSFPRRDVSLAPGLVQVRVTFDAPMSCYAEVMLQGGPQDPCEPEGTWVEPDRRSFLLRCRLAPAARYTLRFARRKGRGFVGLSGRTAPPFELSFSTTNAPPVTTPEQAVRDDPGPANARRTTAYVTCADAAADKPDGDCRHQKLTPPSLP